MTQRNPSNEKIKNEAHQLIEDLFHDYKSKGEANVQDIIDAFQRIRDYDPWHYLSDGELPYDSSQLGKDKKLMTEELLVIFHSGRRYVLQYQANGEKYGEDLWRDPKTGDSYGKYSVKCWQYIEEPQK